MSRLKEIQKLLVSDDSVYRLAKYLCNDPDSRRLEVFGNQVWLINQKKGRSGAIRTCIWSPQFDEPSIPEYDSEFGEDLRVFKR
jgi:hypothetical protein